MINNKTRSVVRGRFKKIGPVKLPALLSGGRTGNFDLFFYGFGVNKNFYVLVKNKPQSKATLVRIHSACSFAHVFHSQRCDCEEQLNKAMELVSESPSGSIY